MTKVPFTFLIHHNIWKEIMMNALCYDLNISRILPRILEIDVKVLPKLWADFCKKNRIKLFAVIGYENEVENIKIWPASGIIASGIARGKHIGTDTIIDSTSGNFGVALAVVLKKIREIDPNFPVRRVKAVIPRNTPQGKRDRLISAGVELVLAEDSLHAQQVARELADKSGYWYTEQYWNPDNPASYEDIGFEIARHQPELAMMGIGVGSGGSLSGIMPTLVQGLEEQHLHRVAIVVEAGQSVGGVRTEQGLEPGTLPWRDNVDDVRFVGTRESVVFSAALWRQNQSIGTTYRCLCGPSGGFSLCGILLALRALGMMTKGLDPLRDSSGYVQAAFFAPDTRKPYRSEYEEHGIFPASDVDWEIPVLSN